MSGCKDCTSCGTSCRESPPTANLPADRPLVVWDGDCAFCGRWIRRMHALIGEELAWAPFQKAASHYPSIPKDAFEKAIHLIDTDGTSVRGAEAVCEIMARGDVRRWPRHVYRTVPGVRQLSELAYRWVAKHRGAANRISTIACGPLAEPSTLLLTRRIFLRLLGLIYLIAFLSLGQQIMALAGDEGLRPARNLILAAQQYNLSWLDFPTAQWLAGDWLLMATSIVGGLSAIALIVGIFPGLSVLLCWIAYLSLTTAAEIFLSYQWDALLLECGILAILWAPWTRRLNSARTRRPSRLVHWLIILLLFRLIFFGGLVKLQSGDPVWMDGTALQYHFWTQPLPWRPAWWANAMPDALLHIGCILMFIIELGAPWLLLLPRIPRTIGAVSIALLMLGIAFTGNYGFFNWLTFVLCLAVLDDAVLLRLWPRAARPRLRVGLGPRSHPWFTWMRSLAAITLLVITLTTCWSQFTGRPSALVSIEQAISPWRMVNRYGLFADMTTTRPEIRVEWQNEDGTWQPIIWRHKPQHLDAPTPLSQPGMPRLDWQLWFDALTYERAYQAGLLSQAVTPPRFTGREVLPDLLPHLMNPDSPVQSLIANPIDGTRPVAIRWHLDQLTFAETPDKDHPAAWWTRSTQFSSPSLQVHPRQ